MLAACPYPQLFEPQVVPRPSGQQITGMPALSPYAIETPFPDVSQATMQDSCFHPGDTYSFDMVLTTPAAIGNLSLIIATWRQAFAKGVGKGDGKAKLLQVEHRIDNDSAEIIYTDNWPYLKPHLAEVTLPMFNQPEDVLLNLQTPLRIEQQGRLIREQDLTPRVFLRHLIRRVSFNACAQQADAFSLADIHQLNALADEVKEGERQLTWCDWERYSSRQKQKMKLGGLVGRWQLLQVPAPLLPFVHLGQWLHVGKEGAFGLGKYQWEKTAR